MDESKETPKNKDERGSFLEQAKELASRNEKAVAEMRILVEKNEELAARNLLGGKTDAGVQPPAKVEETPVDYAKRIMGGHSKGKV